MSLQTSGVPIFALIRDCFSGENTCPSLCRQKCFPTCCQLVDRDDFAGSKELVSIVGLGWNTSIMTRGEVVINS